MTDATGQTVMSALNEPMCQDIAKAGSCLLYTSIGTMIYSQKEEKFQVKKGPVFANFVLADEINRAPAKVQSALLEAMQEHQVTIGETTFGLPKPFLVMATQNPIEQEGTYELPEAQAVSYTHLDVYKRQPFSPPLSPRS